MSSLRIMTFNVRGANRKDGANIWPRRASLNVETIRLYHPDLIGFQECQPGNLAVYRERLPEYEHVLGPQAGSGDPCDHNAISWQPTRLTQLDVGSFWLSETPDVHSFGWDAACVRAVHWMRFKLADNGKEFLHINTHLDHVGEQARQEGVRLILRRLESSPFARLPVVVTGDFNCPPSSPAHRIFTDAGFVDTYTEAGHVDDEQAGTFHGFYGKDFAKVGTEEAQWRIDWLLLRDPSNHLQPTSCEIIRDAQPPLYPSDHYPVLTEFGVG